MGMLSQGKPLPGDPIENTHAGLPAGAVEGEVYVSDPTTKCIDNQGSSGNIPDATYEYKYTFVIRNPATDAVLGETGGSTESDGVTVSGGPAQVELTGVLTSTNPHVNGRRIYRDLNGDGIFKLVGVIRDNVRTTYTDNAESTVGQPNIPTTNSTGQAIIANVPTGTAVAMGMKEADTYRFGVNSKGNLLYGALSPGMPAGYAHISDWFCRNIDSTSTYTVATTLLVVTGIFGPDASNTHNLQVSDGTPRNLCIMTNAGSNLNWILHNPIVLDVGWVLQGSGSSDYIVTGYRIADTGYITPKVVALSTSPSGTSYTVPANTVFVLSAVSCAEGVYLQVEDDATATPRSILGDQSLCYDNAGGGVSESENRVTSPMVFPANTKFWCSSALTCNIWGYEVAIT